MLQGLRVGISFEEFRQLQEVGVFSYLVISYLKCHENGVWGAVRPKWPSISVPRKWDCMLEVGTALGQSTAGQGTVLHSLKIYFFLLKVSM